MKKVIEKKKYLFLELDTKIKVHLKELAAKNDMSIKDYIKKLIEDAYGKRD